MKPDEMPPPTHASQQFSDLLAVIDRLLGPGGCPWDHQQTLHSLQEDLIEETYEVIEAVDEQDPEHITEELGDLFFLLLLLIRIGERDGFVKIDEIFERTTKKFIQRHPHVFGNEQINNAEHALEMWEEWKKQEKSQQSRKSLLDGIPKRFPSLSRAQKMHKKMQKANFPFPKSSNSSFEEQLFSLIQQANDNNIDLEPSFAAFLSQQEKNFRSWENQNTPK